MDKLLELIRNIGAIWFLALIGLSAALFPLAILSFFGPIPDNNMIWVASAVLGGSVIGFVLRRS